VRYIIRQIPAGEILHTKINVTSGEKRGRSDLFPILGWLKRLKDFYTAETIRAQAAAAYVWDDLVKGGPADIAAHVGFLKNNPPQAGEVFIHNEAIERTFKGGIQRGPNLGGTGDAAMN